MKDDKDSKRITYFFVKEEQQVIALNISKKSAYRNFSSVWRFYRYLHLSPALSRLSVLTYNDGSTDFDKC